jgi:branched-chain amino acid aminotransferase
MHELKKAIYENRVLEMFGAGTACVVSPIERIHYMGENLLIPTMENSDSVWIQMRNTLLDIQYGRVKHPWAIEID